MGVKTLNREVNLIRSSFLPPKGNLRGRVVSGVAWQFGLTAIRIIISIVSTAVLARLLTPEDYGLVAMSTLTMEMAGLLSNLGFAQIIVQKERLYRIDLDSVFWFSLIVGCCLLLLAGVISYPVAWFYDKPELVGVIWVAGINFVLRELFVVPNAILHRLLLFKVEALTIMMQLVLRTTFAIYFAWSGLGYWSLVVGPLLASLIEIIVASVYVGFIPRWKISAGFLRKNWRINGSYLGSGILGYIMGNLDYIMVGRRFGAEQLGFYQIAYSLPDELRNRLSGPLQRVLFPAFALLQADLASFRVGVVRSQRLLSIVVLPIGAGMALTAEHLVKLLYGEQWLPVIPLLRILAINGALRAMFSLVGSIYYARGRPEIALKINLYSLPYVVTLVIAGSHWGVQGIAWAMLLALLPSFYSVSIAFRLLEGSAMLFYKACFPAFVLSMIMASFVFLIGNFGLVLNAVNIQGGQPLDVILSYLSWFDGLSDFHQLVFKSASGIAIYFGMMFVFFKSIFDELVSILYSLLGKE